MNDAGLTLFQHIAQPESKWQRAVEIDPGVFPGHLAISLTSRVRPRPSRALKSKLNIGIPGTANPGIAGTPGIALCCTPGATLPTWAGDPRHTGVTDRGVTLPPVRHGRPLRRKGRTTSTGGDAWCHVQTPV